MLPDVVLDIIKAQPHFASNTYVLAGREGSYIQGMSKRKVQFDRKVGIAPWVFHDLRLLRKETAKHRYLRVW